MKFWRFKITGFLAAMLLMATLVVGSYHTHSHEVSAKQECQLCLAHGQSQADGIVVHTVSVSHAETTRVVLEQTLLISSFQFFVSSRAPPLA